MSEFEKNENETKEDGVEEQAQHADAKLEARERRNAGLVALGERIVAHINQPNYRPVKPRVIAKQLGLSPEERNEVRRAIKKLVKKGLAVFGAQHLVGPIHAPPPKTTAKQNKYAAEAEKAKSKQAELDEDDLED